MFFIRGEWMAVSDSNFSKFADPHDGQVIPLRLLLESGIELCDAPVREEVSPSSRTAAGISPK